MVTALSLLVGFVAGMAFQAYRVGTARETVAQAPDSSPMGSPEAGPDREILELEDLVSEKPDRAEAWARLGHAYFDRDRFQEAIKAYGRSLDLDPSDPDVWTDLGVMYRRSGQPREAVRCFDRAAEVSGTHEISRFNKGVVLLHDLNDPEGAVRAWEDLVRVNPEVVSPDGRPLLELIDTVKRDRGIN
jgi:cytochrome c-type biogenesis protein CcmH/NrfG